MGEEEEERINSPLLSESKRRTKKKKHRSAEEYMCGCTSLQYLGLLSVLQGNLLLSSVESPTKYGVGRTLES